MRECGSHSPLEDRQARLSGTERENIDAQHQNPLVLDTHSGVLLFLVETLLDHLARSALFAFGFANALCSHPVRARIVVRIPPTAEILRNSSRPTDE